MPFFHTYIALVIFYINQRSPFGLAIAFYISINSGFLDCHESFFALILNLVVIFAFAFLLFTFSITTKLEFVVWTGMVWTAGTYWHSILLHPGLGASTAVQGRATPFL